MRIHGPRESKDDDDTSKDALIDDFDRDDALEEGGVKIIRSDGCAVTARGQFTAYTSHMKYSALSKFVVLPRFEPPATCWYIVETRRFQLRTDPMESACPSHRSCQPTLLGWTSWRAHVVAANQPSANKY